MKSVCIFVLMALIALFAAVRAELSLAEMESQLAMFEQQEAALAASTEMDSSLLEADSELDAEYDFDSALESFVEESAKPKAKACPKCKKGDKKCAAKAKKCLAGQSKKAVAPKASKKTVKKALKKVAKKALKKAGKKVTKNALKKAMKKVPAKALKKAVKKVVKAKKNKTSLNNTKKRAVSKVKVPAGADMGGCKRKFSLLKILREQGGYLPHATDDKLEKAVAQWK